MERGGSFQKPPPPVATKPSRSKSTTERSLQRSDAQDSETSLSRSSTSGDPATYDEFIESKGMNQGDQESWMSRLDVWKLRRRNVTQSALERKASREEVEENEQSKHRRRSKTYQEMMEEKEKREKILMKMASQHKSLDTEDVVHILTKPSLYEEEDDESKNDEVFTSLPPVHDDAESDESSEETVEEKSLHDNELKGPETQVPSYHYQGVKPVAWTPQKKRVSLGILGRLAAFNKGESDDHEKPHQSVPLATSRVAELTLAQDSEQEKEAPIQKDSADNSESIPAPQSNDHPQSQSHGLESSTNYRPVKFVPKRHSVPLFTSRFNPKPLKNQSMDDTSVEDTKPDMEHNSLKKETDSIGSSSESDKEPAFSNPGAPAGQQVDDSVPLSTRKTFRVEEEKKRLERLHAERDRIRQEQYEQEQRRLREQQENGLPTARREGRYKVEKTQIQLERSEILKEPITQERQRVVLQRFQPHVGLDQNDQGKERNENKQRQRKDDHFQQQIKEERKSEEMVEEAERRRIPEKTRFSYPDNRKMAAIPGRDVDLEPVIEKKIFAPVASSALVYQRDKSPTNQRDQSPTQISMDVNREKDLHHHPQLSEEMGNERNWDFNLGVEAIQKTEQNILEKENANKQMYAILREEEIERIRAEEKEKLQKEWEELLREKARQEERERLEQERLEQLRAEQERLRQERIKLEQQQERPMIHSTRHNTDADHLYSSSERLSSKNPQDVKKGGSNVENEDRQQFRVIMGQEEIERIRAEEKEKLQKEWEELLRERSRQEERERLEVVEKGGNNVKNEDRQQFRVIVSQEKTGIKEQFSENNNKGSYHSGQSHVTKIQGGQMDTRHWLVEEAERRRIAEKTNKSSYPHDPKKAAIHGRDVDLEPVVEKKIFAPVASSAPAYRRDKSPNQISMDVKRSHEKDLHRPQIPSHVSRDLQPQRGMKTSKFEAELGKLPPGYVRPDAKIQPKQPLSAPGRTSVFKQPTKSSTGARSVSSKVRCSECGKSLNRGSAMIIEPLDLYFHIDCFKCCVCNIQLGNGTKGTDVRLRASKLHCQNCHSSEAGFEFTQV